ncbi:hypothetical protein HMPREF0511_0382 [Limosilactobacillus fermentum ATCC 14931]|nr:hypothetical protein HMPREF0511_0382 [Limosilactobacillus fermentum ATCC 14931]
MMLLDLKLGSGAIIRPTKGAFKMENVRLNNGITAPILGFGTYQISPSQTKAAVAEALKLGYRSIDTAQYYRNEAGVGAAVKESGLPREELFITTKAMTTGYRATKLGSTIPSLRPGWTTLT